MPNNVLHFISCAPCWDSRSSTIVRRFLGGSQLVHRQVVLGTAVAVVSHLRCRFEDGNMLCGRLVSITQDYRYFPTCVAMIVLATSQK